MNAIGIMQGRLSPPVKGHVQSFPVNTWQEEFYLAHKAGLDCIEWVYEEKTEAENPLRTNKGRKEIKQLIADSGTMVRSICADYYMAQQLVASNGMPIETNIQHLKKLIRHAGLLDIHHIVLPFVDTSSLHSLREIEGLLSVLKSVLGAAQYNEVELHLETDLKPLALLTVLERIAHRLVKINYDIGNSAALGRTPLEELPLLIPWIGSIHVKDRILSGNSVPLGTGAADFPTCFRLLHAGGFRGQFILQAAREEGISEIELAIRNRRFVELQLAAATNRCSELTNSKKCV